MAFIDYRLSTSSKKSVVIPFRCCSNDEPVYILTSVNGWNAVEMTKVGTVDSGKNIHLYEHTVILPGDVSNIQYKFRVGQDLYFHDVTEDTSKFNAVNETRRSYSVFLAPDGFGGWNNTFEVRWDPIYSISTREPSCVIKTPSGPGSLQVSEDEPAPVGISQMPSIDLPAASDQELHAVPGSALHASQTLRPELVSTTPGAINEPETEESGHTPQEKVSTVRIDAMTVERQRSKSCEPNFGNSAYIDIIQDAVRPRTLSERLYGPSKPSRPHLSKVEITHHDSSHRIRRRTMVGRHLPEQ